MSVFLSIVAIAAVLGVIGAVLIATTSSASGFEGRLVKQPVETNATKREIRR